MSNLRIALVIGTRPEIIKTWSFVRAAEDETLTNLVLIHTGQHYDYEMSEVFFEDLDIRQPDYYLNAGHEKPIDKTAHIMEKLGPILDAEGVDVLVVQGDTNSTMAAALTASQMRIPVAHIESGCRSYDKTMPEEINRIIVDSVANVLYAPTRTAYVNLMREGRDPKRVFQVGNTSVEALNKALSIVGDADPPYPSPYVLITLHRAENVDNNEKLREIVVGLLKTEIPSVFPIHPRTKKQLEESGLIEVLKKSGISLTPPMTYLRFLNTLRHASLVVTDSGGVQEEAAILGKPTVTLRMNTEWPETIWYSENRVVKPDAQVITNVIRELRNTPSKSKRYTPDINAGNKILEILIEMHRSGDLGYQSSDMVSDGYPVPKLCTTPDETTSMSFDAFGNISDVSDGKRFLNIVSKPLDK